ncbi:MAG: NUDIX hydrolase [Cyclobacteriaceae bacterium]
MATRDLLIESLHAYQSLYKEELEFKISFLELLNHPRAFFRDHLPGHITASSWIINPSGKFTLLTHHAKLDRWLQPGGHADGEEDITGVAKKEALEETGLSLKLKRTAIFDLDIHRIPPRMDFPEHLHYDIRFLFEGNMDETFVVSEESRSLAWIALANIAEQTQNNTSMMRMAEKVSALFRTDQ